MAVTLTIKDAIKKLKKAKKKSKIKGGTVIYLCVPDLEYIPVTDLILDEDEDGAVMLVKVGHLETA